MHGGYRIPAAYSCTDPATSLNMGDKLPVAVVLAARRVQVAKLWAEVPVVAAPPRQQAQVAVAQAVPPGPVAAGALQWVRGFHLVVAKPVPWLTLASLGLQRKPKGSSS